MTQAEATAEHELIGKTIAGKFKIVRLLGEGGMGCVYLGEQMLGTTTRKVAVKTLHKHLSHDASIKARFQREVGTVAALEHPNTIQVFDFGAMEDGTLYIVMEFVQGRSVADILEKDGAMPPERVENIMRQVVGSLEEAHNHGIVHRDLKPDNVVLCERAGQKDWVEVLDFGIAKRSSEHDPNEAKLTQQGMVLGTPPYMSPEQFTGQPVDVRSDIYALGVMSYEMLTGRLPWEANTAWEWASKHMTEAPTPLERQPLGPNVPEKMRNTIARALAKNKDERFGSVREFFDGFSGATMTSSPARNQSGYGPAPVGGTAVMGAHGLHGSNANGREREREPMSDPGRAKTEMGAPMMGGPVDAAPQMSMGPGPAMAPIAVPAGPAHSPAKKSGPPMLIIGLGGLAGLLLVGAVIFAVVGRKPKQATTTTALDLNGTSTAAVASSVAHVDEPPPVVTSAAPLDSSAIKIPPVPNNNASTSGGAKTPTTPTKPSVTPVPTPTPVKADPPECAKYRADKASGTKTKTMLASQEARCRAAGGSP
jgi:eukaryotic-like serine/threonine-protein kinase